MNASKTLIAAIVAATIVGTMGFVSAQTSDSDAPAAPSTDPAQRPVAGAAEAQPPAAASAPADMSSPPYVAPDSSAPAAPSDPAASTITPTTDSGAPAVGPLREASAAAEPAPKPDRT